MSMLVAFFTASFVLAVTPGPGVLYVVMRTLAQGRRAALASVAGVALGNLGNAVGASLALAALFALSSIVFSSVKLAGALYLVWLGIKTLLVASPHCAIAVPAARVAAPACILREGFLVALLNPRTALFFAAFLPQFVTPAGSPMLQSVCFGGAFVVLAATTDSAYVLAARRLAVAFTGLDRAQHYGRYVTAAAFLVLGLCTAMDAWRAGA